MIAIISPAKTLDYESRMPVETGVQIPDFTKNSRTLINLLKKKKVSELQQLMGISEKLAVLNRKRYKEWTTDYTLDNSRPAIYAFKGDVYLGLDAYTMTNEDLDFAEKSLRILSGLYGVLKPLDSIQPYRLEMGARLENRRGTNLYQYWGDELTKALNTSLEASDSKQLLNLASNEYFKAINKKKLKGTIYNVDFRENRGGELKFISFNAKKARGLLARYVINNRLTDVSQIESFDQEGYRLHNIDEQNGAYLFVKN